ncbi:hypothetical protein LNTAR_08424 [Lentisphaera araneosa HTCC2155]|uniref:Uncharacterized protein n=1 Tax=Lentisphaera araneosa HTCC2155 TaxID=313628 RepID=A6DHS6_9BACT|nr:hypothetical protein [Lentisphaera araneosa]EDM28580.1 hypothetical protein LNTAR_08424 [Lentisphaera araneosa HTCC2155]
MKLETLEGVIIELDKSTQVSGTDRRSGLTHKARFKVGDERILLKTTSEANMQNGDRIKIVGLPDAGDFKAIVYKNLSNSWQSDQPKLGFAPFMLSLFIFFTATMSAFARPFIILCLIVGVVLFNLLKVYKTNKEAYSIMMSEES